MPLSHLDVTSAGYPFIPFFSENDLCSKLDILVSEEGALHNRQIWPEAPRVAKLSSQKSWAHKLHWCGIIWFFACGASLPSLCAVLLLSYHLSYPELTFKYTVFSLLSVVWLCARFILMLLHRALCVAKHIYLIFLILHFMFNFYAVSQSFGSQSARLADWRVSGSSHPHMITSQLLKSELLCCFLPQCWGTWMAAVNVNETCWLCVMQPHYVPCASIWVIWQREDE